MPGGIWGSGDAAGLLQLTPSADGPGIQAKLGSKWWNLKDYRVYARDYGWGDGVTGDATAFNAALTVAQAHGNVEIDVGGPDISPNIGANRLGGINGITGDCIIRGDGVTISYACTGAPASPVFHTGTRAVSSVAITADAAQGESQITVADSSTFTAGDFWHLTGTTTFNGEAGTLQGEVVEILSVVDATHILIAGNLADTYLAVNSPILRKLTLARLVMDGIRWLNTAPTGLGTAVVWTRYSRRNKLDLEFASGFNGSGIVANVTLDSFYRAIGLDGGQQQTAANQAFGYVALAMDATQNCRFDIISRGGESGFQGDGSSTGGVPRNCTVDVSVEGNAEQAVGTHQCSEGITFRIRLAHVRSKGYSTRNNMPPGVSLFGLNHTIESLKVDGIQGTACEVHAAGSTIKEADILNAYTNSIGGSDQTGNCIELNAANILVDNYTLRGFANAGIVLSALATGARIGSGYMKGPGAGSFGIFTGDTTDSMVVIGRPTMENVGTQVYYNGFTPAAQLRSDAIRILNPPAGAVLTNHQSALAGATVAEIRQLGRGYLAETIDLANCTASGNVATAGVAYTCLGVLRAGVTYHGAAVAVRTAAAVTLFKIGLYPLAGGAALAQTSDFSASVATPPAGRVPPGTFTADYTPLADTLVQVVLLAVGANPTLKSGFADAVTQYDDHQGTGTRLMSEHNVTGLTDLPATLAFGTPNLAFCFWVGLFGP